MDVEAVEQVFQEVFEKPELRIHPAMTAAEVDNWDFSITSILWSRWRTGSGSR